MTSPRSAAGIAERRGLLVAFSVFGSFWGAWAALLPAVRETTGVDDSQLGLALAAIAVSALPAMLVAGPRLDRAGPRVLRFALVAFALVVPLPSLAGGLGTLVLSVVGLGVTTGILDVVVNATTAGWERAEGNRLMAGCHGVFSLGVLLGSIATGLARDAGAGPGLVLPVVSLLVLVAAALQPAYRREARAERPAGGMGLPPVLFAVGALVAAAFLVEDGLTTWSALQLERGLHAPPWVSGLGPGLFSASMAVGRLATQLFESSVGQAARRDGAVLAFGGLGVAAGALLLAFASGPVLGLVGLALAGAGTSVLAPTLLSAVGERSAPGRQGADLAHVTMLGYAGFVTGPPAVGLISGATSLPVALGLLSVVGVVLAVGGPLALRPRRVAVPA